MTTLYCVGCARDVQPRLVSGAEVYPHRPDLAEKRFWKCGACGNYVGCHPGTTRALGNIPTPELRAVRMRIHAIIDPLWRGKKMRRRQVYARLGEHLGREYHTGEIKSVAEARSILEFASALASGAVREKGNHP